MRRELRILGLSAGLLGAGVAAAQTPAEIQRSYETAARQAAPAFGGFSAQRGETFFKSPHGGDWSCASCHTQSPVAAGRHAVTGKTITPLAPAASPARFTDPAKVEKWFTRNCNDVLKRACTPAEKGDVLAYLISLK
jgi:hypothetical protein